MRPLPLFALLLLVIFAVTTTAAPLQSFTVKDYLRHQWTNEFVQFPVDFPGEPPPEMTLTDEAGTPVPCQFSGLTTQNGRTTGTVWTVLTLAPKASATLHLQAGTPPPTALTVEVSDNTLFLRNEHLALELPRFTRNTAGPVDLARLPAPLLSLRQPGNDTPLGQGAWVNDGQPLQVTASPTMVVENGPVRVTIRYRIAVDETHFYQADISLGAGQEVALFSDETSIAAPHLAFRFSFHPGLDADRVYWRSNYYATPNKGLEPAPIDFTRERLLAKLCPWAYWWLEDQTTWAGFYHEGQEPLVGVLALRPSRWSPTQWEGFARTAAPITARPGGQIDLSLPLLAYDGNAPDSLVRSLLGRDGKQPTGTIPARRELAFTVGTVTEHVTQDVRAIKLRHQLLKHSEFPLDEVKDFHFDFPRRNRRHPFLVFTQDDVDRARLQVDTVPIIKADFDKAVTYMGRLGADLIAKIQSGPDGPERFFRENYVGNGLYDAAPQAYLGSGDPKYGIILAAGVKGMAGQQVDMFLNAPSRPTLGGNGHMAGTTLLRLLLAYDALADTDFLTPDEKADIESALVLGGYVFDHPDYWNTDVGLCSANPNMTSLLKLPLGLVGLYLDGHPRADHWLAYAESELQRELRDWIAPGGAWLECPMYQAPSLDGMFLLAQAIRNVKGKDYFSDPQFKATMEYYGFILTAPDRRFPTLKTADIPPPMTVPSIGDAFPCYTQPFNGWMAKATAQADPAYSARQQAYWRGQSFSCLNGGRAGFIPAVCDPGLPAALPTDTARAFQGFGNVMRTSWTDPRASYVVHRCGYFIHHFDPGDHNSFMYYAKGAPLCMDFGHRGATGDQVRTMWKPMYHNTVSFDKDDDDGYWHPSSGSEEQSIAGQLVQSLPRTIDYTRGVSYGRGGQMHTRHLLLTKSDDPLGATYLVVRDQTVDGQPDQVFSWNLWCMAAEPRIDGPVAHFPGQFGVDLDVHMLAPGNARLEPDSYGYEQWVNPWGKFREDQTAIRVRKKGSKEDFIALLYPRAEGQPAATVTALSPGALAVDHMEGTDLIVLSPAESVAAARDDLSVQGEIAFARRYTDGRTQLAIVHADGAATATALRLEGLGPVAIRFDGTTITGEADGTARTIAITVPATFTPGDARLDDHPLAIAPDGATLRLSLPAGAHTFTIASKP